MKTLKYSIIIAALAALVSFSCSNLGGDGAGSCKESTYCTDYIGKDFTKDGVKSSCLGEYSEDGCSSANNTGTCVVNGGQPNETKITYYSSGAQANCSAAGGTFVN